MAFADGDDFVTGSILSFQQANRMKNNFRGASAPSNVQPGMTYSDSDDDKFYHMGAVASEEVLQATRSADIIPRFLGADLHSITIIPTPIATAVAGTTTLASGGTYTGVALTTSYQVIIDAGDPANPNTFKWSNDGGATWEAEGVAITGVAQTLDNGVTITFSAITGGVTDDQWDFNAYHTYSTIKQSDAEGLVGSDLRIGLDETLRSVIICDRGDIAVDFGLVAQANPSLYVMNADGTVGTRIIGDAITSPTIYGSVASGGDLTLYSTSHGTLGQIKLESDLETDRWLESDTNTFIGVGVVGAGNLAHTEGSEGWLNSFFGYQAGNAITTGRQNLFLGYQAGVVNDTGYSNSFVGCLSGCTNNSGRNNSFFGYGSGYLVTSGRENCFFGFSAGSNNTTGDANVVVGYLAGMHQNDGTTPLETPEDSVYVGTNTKSGSDPDGGEDAIENEIVIGYDAIGNGAQTVTLGNTNITEFHCQVALTVDSDERIKKDVVPVNAGLAFIEALNPITYKRVNPFDYPDVIKPCNYKDREVTEKDKDGKDITVLVKADPRPPDDESLYMGLVAQQVEAVLTAQGIDTDIVSTSNIGKKSIKYGSLIMPLIKAVQELSEQNKTLSAKIVALEKK